MTIPSNPQTTGRTLPAAFVFAIQDHASTGQPLNAADMVRILTDLHLDVVPAPQPPAGPEADALAQLLRERIWAYGATIGGVGYEPVGAQEYLRAGIDDARDVVLRDPSGGLWDVDIRVTIRRRPTGPCVCGPDPTGEGPDGRPDCPHHGASAVAEYDGEAPY